MEALCDHKRKELLRCDFHLGGKEKEFEPALELERMWFGRVHSGRVVVVVEALCDCTR